MYTLLRGKVVDVVNCEGIGDDDPDKVRKRSLARVSLFKIIPF